MEQPVMMINVNKLQFQTSTPQAMKEQKFNYYDEEKKFTNDDLQDVLDGLLKLGVSNNNNPTTTNNQPTKPPITLSLPYLTPVHSNKSIINNNSIAKSKSKSKSTSTSSKCNRYNPLYSCEPTFIASSKTYQSYNNQLQQNKAGFNLLYEAAKQVEGVSHFKIDIADINRITRKMDDINTNTDLTYNHTTGIIKKKSKNGISPPKIDNPNELLNISSMTFGDLNDDFTPIQSTENNGRESSFGCIKQQLRFSDMHSIGRRSSPSKLENRRLSQEWNNRNLIEINKIYSDKTKLDINNSSIQSKKEIEKLNNLKQLKLNNSKQICDEFSESNNSLLEFNNYKTNINNVLNKHKQTRTKQRQEQNKMLMKKLNDMELKIKKQLQFDEKKRQLHQMQLQKQKDEIEKKKQFDQQQQIIQQQQQQIQMQQQQQQMQQQQQQNQNQIDEKSEWYPHQKTLEEMYKHYKQMYKQFESLIQTFETSNSNLQMDLETHIGLIVRSISANRKSVFDAYKRFEKLINNKTNIGSLERSYSFIQITELIVTDIRIVKSSAQKFASAYFLGFVMNEYYNEYLEIFKCVFYHYCIWTMPYIDKQLRDLKIKRPQFNNNNQSIPRCVLLGYNAIKDIQNVPKDKRKYLQQFKKDNNAGIAIFESENKYFTRMQHIAGLFSAFMSIRNNNQFINPFGIDSGHCWKWIACLLGLPKCIYPELCSILSSIIPIIGQDMLEKYPKQFPKIVKCIKFNIHPICMTTTTTRAKAKRELNLFLKECENSMKNNNGRLILKKPKDSELIEKTVGASALTNNIGDRRRNSRFG